MDSSFVLSTFSNAANCVAGGFIVDFFDSLILINFKIIIFANMDLRDEFGTRSRGLSLDCDHVY